MQSSPESIATSEATSTLRRSDAMIRRLAVVIAFIVAATCALVVYVAIDTAEVIQEDARNDQRVIQGLTNLARDLKHIATASKTASESNNKILEAGRPCIPEDPATPPEHPACVRAAASQAIVEQALKDIATTAHEQHQHLVNVVARLVGKRAPQLPRVVPSTAERIAATAPTVPPRSTPTTTPLPSTTTTTCPKLPNGKCRR